MSTLSGVIARRRHSTPPSPTSPWTSGAYDFDRSSERAAGLATDGTSFALIDGYNRDVWYTTDLSSDPWTLSSNTAPSGVISLTYSNSYWITTTSYGYVCYTSSISGAWTIKSVSSSSLSKAIYSSTASLYIAVGASGSIYTSATLGGTWTSRTSNFGTSTIRSIYDNGSLIVIVGYNGKMATSTDGITWTIRTSGFGTDTIRDLTYDGSLWIIVGDASKIGTSSDPTSSVTINSSTGITAGAGINGIEYEGGIYVAVAETSAGDFNIFETTTPTSTWTTKTFSVRADTSYLYVTANSSYFSAVASSSGRSIYTFYRSTT